MREAEQVRRESDVWNIVNRGRKRRKVTDDGIEEEKWKEHFMRVLEGVDHRIREGDWRERERGGRERDKQGRNCGSAKKN